MIIKSRLSDLEALIESSGSAHATIMQKGEVILQWQAEHPPVDVYAVQKGLLTLLIGIAEEQYLLETLDHINHHLDPEWTQLSPWDEAKLSIETLLDMTTGMADDLSSLGEVNQTWRYNNTAYNYLKQILTLQSGLSLQQLSADWLFSQIDMRQSRWVDRDARLPNGVPISALMSTANDLCRLGQLVLDNGSFKGQQLIPKHFMEKMLGQSPDENPAWSWGWWKNDASKYIKPMREHQGTVSGRLIPSAPNELITARGAYGNYLFILPSEDLVIARTSLPQGARPAVSFETALWELLAR